jgi:hypothetical protein
MKTLLASLCLILLSPVATVAHGAPKAREETAFLFENRKLVVAVPEGFSCVTSKSEDGVITMKLADPKERCSVELLFLPDPEGQLAGARARREKMVELLADYVGPSQEKGMQFEELEPRTGAGTYCVFTDATLHGKENLPPGEYLHLTSGLKTWPGVVTIFRFFSNDTTSAEYRAVMKMLRESVEERGVPLR